MLYEMMDVYCQQVQCVLELGLALWQPGLTEAQAQQLDRVHKCTFYCILGNILPTGMQWRNLNVKQ